ncbi:hypothetical protein AZOA_42240 [Azoarcus sp. Aa7]|nr:hypothetical protein [Azoarcus sp. Aa7]
MRPENYCTSTLKLRPLGFGFYRGDNYSDPGGVYERSYAGFFCGGRRKLEFLPYTPNTLGVTGCVRVVFDERQLYFFQYRGQHESAARGVLHLSYAGTLDAYPKYVRKGVPVSIADLASDEYEDEFFCGSPGRTIATRDPQHMVRHEMVGICANSQYLFQPEIFILTTITLNSEVCMDELKGAYENRISGSFVALPSIESLDDYLIRTDTKLRPLCRVAIDRIYLPRIAASDVMAEAC